MASTPHLPARVAQQALLLSKLNFQEHKIIIEYLTSEGSKGKSMLYRAKTPNSRHYLAGDIGSCFELAPSGSPRKEWTPLAAITCQRLLQFRSNPLFALESFLLEITRRLAFDQAAGAELFALLHDILGYTPAREETAGYIFSTLVRSAVVLDFTLHWQNCTACGLTSYQKTDSGLAFRQEHWCISPTAFGIVCHACMQGTASRSIVLPPWFLKLYAMQSSGDPPQQATAEHYLQAARIFVDILVAHSGIVLQSRQSLDRQLLALLSGS